MRAADRPALTRLPFVSPWALLALALVLAPAFTACDADDARSNPYHWDVPGDLSSDVPVDEVRGGGGEYPETSTEAQILALEEVNRFRAASGLPPVNAIESLNQASQAHADFIVGNCRNYDEGTLSPHDEDPDWPGFTGIDAMDRANAAGFRGIGMRWVVGEVIAFLNQPEWAVAGWIRTLYHRLPLLDPRTLQIGYGGAYDDTNCQFSMFQSADVITAGQAGDAEDTVVLYPPAGSTGIPKSFDGRESPEPIRPASGWPSGTIITVQFGKERAFTVTGHRLLENGGDEVSHLIVASKADAASGVLKDPFLAFYQDIRTLALYAERPLKSGTEYTVVLDLVRGGEPLQIEWTFKTEGGQD